MFLFIFRYYVPFLMICRDIEPCKYRVTRCNKNTQKYTADEPKEIVDSSRVSFVRRDEFDILCKQEIQSDSFHQPTVVYYTKSTPTRRRFLRLLLTRFYQNHVVFLFI